MTKQQMPGLKKGLVRTETCLHQLYATSGRIVWDVVKC